MAIAGTAIWRVRPSGNNANGGGYDPGIAGAATDYSQQNAAQASGTAGTASGTTAFSDAAGVFTAAMVGNAICIASGSGFTVGFYFVVGYTSATVVTLDRSPGTGSAAVWKLGGGWANPWTNTTSAVGCLVPGNIVYILGTGITAPSASSYDYDFSTVGFYFTPPNGTYNGGLISFENDPNTPSGAYVSIRVRGAFIQGNTYLRCIGLYFIATTADYTSLFDGDFFVLENCVLNQNGHNISFINRSGFTVLGCEIFDSAGASGGGNPVIYISGTSSRQPVLIQNCNIHDCNGPAIIAHYPDFTVSGCIIAKNSGDGIQRTTDYANSEIIGITITNNTIDGNTGNGMTFPSVSDLNSVILNNIISNHTGAGKSGIACTSGTAATNDLAKWVIDYNTFYNNTTDLTALNYGPHDTHSLGSSPYVASSTENYTLA